MPAARHLQYADFEAAWESVLRPWFEANGLQALEQSQPIVVTCPHGALVALLKQRLLEEKIPVLGVHFTSSGSLRRLLSPILGETSRLALREDLHLLARLAAEELGDEPVARSVAADPSALVRALDTLEAGGWGPEHLPLAEATGLGKRTRALLEQCGLQSVRRLDWRLRERASQTKPLFANWLAIGFSSQDWPEFALLQAAYQTAEESTLCFLAEGERPASAAWTGAWEEIAGPVEAYLAADPDASRPLGSLADRFASHLNGSEEAVDFIVTRSQAAESKAVLKEAKAAWANQGSRRIGIVVPPSGSGPAREISLQFAESGLPHQDRIGYRPAKSSAHRLFSTWLEFQSQQSLGSLLNFARALREAGKLSPAQYQALGQASENCFFELMTSQLAPLAAMDRQAETAEGILAEFLENWPLLPPEAEFKAFAETCLEPLSKLAWPEDLESLEERLMRLGVSLAGRSISRAAFLQWLSAVADIPGRSRAETAREPFAPWQLLTLREAAGQAWDTLIFAGMAQGEWPPELPESSYLPQETLRKLNARALRQGPQGEGHLVVIPGYALMPVRVDEALRAEDSLALLLGSVTGSLVATTSLSDPSTPSRSREVSEWFLRLHTAARGAWPSPKELAIQAATTELLYTQASADEDVSDVRKAFLNRRNETVPFDRYSYSLNTVPSGGLRLSASVWSRLFTHPASVWYEHILRAAPPFDPAHEEPSKRARGTWLHAWLRPDEGTAWRVLPDTAAWKSLVRERANLQKERARQAFEAANRPLPAWWLSDWSAALGLALDFVDVLSQSPSGYVAQSEWPLPKRAYRLTSDASSIPLKGRMDLVLADRVPLLDDETVALPGHVLVVDYKTGKDKSLSERELRKGNGIQLAVYAMALRDLIGIEVEAVMLTANAEFKAQLGTVALSEITELWQAVNAVVTTGRIGDWPESDFGHSEPRPLAVLSVPEEILRAKWALTHPGITPV